MYMYDRCMYTVLHVHAKSQSPLTVYHNAIFKYVTLMSVQFWVSLFVSVVL